MHSGFQRASAALLGTAAIAFAAPAFAQTTQTASVSDKQAVGSVQTESGVTIKILGPKELGRALKAQGHKTCDELFAEHKPCVVVNRTGSEITVNARGSSQGGDKAVAAAPPVQQAQAHPLLNPYITSITKIPTVLPTLVPMIVPVTPDDWGCQVKFHGPFTSKCIDYTAGITGTIVMQYGVDPETGEPKVVYNSGIATPSLFVNKHSGPGWLRDISEAATGLANVSNAIVNWKNYDLFRQEFKAQGQFQLGLLNDTNITSMFAGINCGIGVASQSNAGNVNGTCVLNSNVNASGIGANNGISTTGSSFGGGRIASPGGPGG